MLTTAEVHNYKRITDRLIRYKYKEKLKRTMPSKEIQIHWIEDKTANIFCY